MGVVGWVGSGDLGAPGEIGQGREGDVESEAVKSLDVGADLTVEGAPVVVVHAQVLVACARVGQQRVVNPQLAVRGAL